MNIIAIIPARGGSKGIPQKNIIDLGGLPLLAWSIRVARAAKVLDEVYVSTDDDEIAKIAKEYGARVPFLRPKELATDKATTVDAISHFILKLKMENNCPDIVVLLQPTQPFRSVETIIKAIEAYKLTGSGVVSVSRVAEHPVLMRYFDKSTSVLTRLLGNVNSTVRRQDFSEVYRVNGAVYVNSVEDYLQKKSLNDNPIGVITTELEGVDIDTLDDLDYARFLIQHKKLVIPS
jgi:CMP-N,N'-diacetyllegionaminic acid synthase